METIDTKRIVSDISKDKYDIFVLEFPELKTNIDELKAKPTCGSCVSANLPPITSHPKFIEKMKMIYGSDIKIESKNFPLTQPKFNTKAEVTNVPLKDWENWWKTNAGDPKKQFRIINTFFNPKTETVVVSTISLSPEKS